MRKRILSLALLVAMLAALTVPAAMAEDAYPMYVCTGNGRTLNLREAPNTNSKVLCQIPYGDEVWISYKVDKTWSYGHWAGQFGYMQTRFLVSTKPTAKPVVTPKPADQKTDEQKALEALNKELKTLKTVDEPFIVVARPSRATGWVNFRVGPGTSASRIATFPDGKEARVVGETTSWYQVVDPDTNRTGFVSKKYMSVVPKAVIVQTITSAADSKQHLGSLNVNGQFTLQCKLPEGYTLQPVTSEGDKVIASITPVDITKPQLYLSVSFDDSYADLERLNDLSDEGLAILEGTFTDMNEVEITYRTTAYGTKLLVAREIGADVDFVDILSVYKGYFVEFIMTPSTAVANKTLTDEQIRMCVDFLSDLDFVPVAQ